MGDKSEGLKTNEQIIEELTKDLENSCIRAGENDSPDSTSARTGDDSSCNRAEKNSDDGNECETDSVCGRSRKDSVDEESLKDRDLTLSENEKESLKNEAEECKTKGNEFFNKGEYQEAISMYTQGLQTCPLAYSKERSILYANRAAAKSKSLDQESAISDCTKAIELNPDYVKAYVRRAQLYEASDKLDEALEDYKKILTFDAAHSEANHAVLRLPPMINERNEKLKTEMLGKLKDLGNMILKPFGLSTNNFELQKNPDSDGYSVKFNQNPN
ncbi:tetratricopeptide repeat protein 1 [Ceratina calcarata]|uniref:Tetratricopeptide repeat protein 1 n=1 Tax=Ceratina calcarata TaxID=156304 RepID=A0AAJ7JGW8_9HYME|nr:tetratricopeptide repeat protein 1 [Ceratina calcarata]